MTGRVAPHVCRAALLLLLVATGLPAQPASTAAPAVRTRTSVLLRPPIGVRDTGTSRRPASVTGVSAAMGTQPVALARDSSSSTMRLARELYGARARALTLRNTQRVMVFLDDSARIERAPPGLGVAEGVALPVRFVARDSATGDLMALKPWFDDGGGLRYDSRTASYVATLRLGVRDSLNGTRTRPLTPAVRFSIVAAADSVAPGTVALEETNVFTQSARLVTTRRDAAMRVEIWPDFAEQSIKVWVPFRRDTLLVAVDRPRVDGLGLDALTVTVAVPPGALASDDSIAVMLQSSRGTLEQQTLYPKGNAPATTRLRSAGIGAVSITARSAALDDGVTTTRFTAPLGLLAGAALGALAGSAMLILRDRTRSRRKHLVPVLASGILSGLVVALVVALGVLNLPGLDLPAGSGSLVALLAGVIGGYVGPKGLEALMPSLAAGRTAAPRD
ncbi:MAG: hypothetical protein MUF00_17430 [Gemmatimonadaceae bacterium]|nr:hypothetical protein [Gemmatimonadaceae bacterium]